MSLFNSEFVGGSWASLVNFHTCQELKFFFFVSTYNVLVEREKEDSATLVTTLVSWSSLALTKLFSVPFSHCWTVPVSQGRSPPGDPSKRQISNQLHHHHLPPLGDHHLLDTFHAAWRTFDFVIFKLFVSSLAGRNGPSVSLQRPSVVFHRPLMEINASENFTEGPSKK